jgi:hypothetical protein
MNECNRSKTSHLVSFSPQLSYNSRATAAVDKVVVTFAGRGLCVAAPLV